MPRIVIMLAGLLLLFAGAIPATATGTAQAPRVHVIVVDKMAFGPMPAGVRAGDIIEWVNHDIFEHSATARDGSFDVDLKPGASVRTTAKPGTVAFFCKFHPTMQATLVVK
ncbi:MAG: cupredoxin domain-containing protein [Rhodanobacter sp.]|jgi:plastocyanin|nr:cupredoxin domain-containing protein [Rhodanobacter sp.]OJW29434.1 MAG: plasmid stabilization protein [Rhodanobacter sp. 67-28]